jgi:hypothetical protein
MKFAFDNSLLSSRLTSNQNMTHDGIEAMAHRLFGEIALLLDARVDLKLSFIGHSLGWLIYQFLLD